jgi:hypothetical protein
MPSATEPGPASRWWFASSGVCLLLLLGASIFAIHAVESTEWARDLHGPIGCVFLPFVLIYGSLAIANAVLFRRQASGRRTLLRRLAVYAPTVAFVGYLGFLVVSILW